MLFSIPGVENLSQTTVTIVALVLALVLVAFFGLILRRLTGGRLSLKSDRGRARQPRLGIVDVYDLDRQRQLILLRRDNVEHLLLVGGPNDVVVETNIVRAGGSRLPVTPVDAQDRADPAAERSVEIAPVRPVLESAGIRAAEPVMARLGAADTTTRGTIEPALKPSSVTAAPGVRSVDRSTQPNGSPTLAGEPGMDTSRIALGGAAPAPRQVSPAAGTGRPDMAKQLEEALARPAPDPRPAPTRTLELPRATPVAQPGRLMSAFRKADPAPVPAPNIRTEPAPPSIAASEPTSRSVPGPVQIEAQVADARREHGRDEPVRQDAARQEPGSSEPQRQPELPQREPVQQEPVQQRPEQPETGQQGPDRHESERDQDVEGQRVEPDLVRSDPVRPDPVKADPAQAELVREDVPQERESKPREVSAPPPAPQVRTISRPVQAAAPTGPVIVPPPPPLPASPARNDPFSIEDIEAEFARLLGRPIDKRDDRT